MLGVTVGRIVGLHRNHRNMQCNWEERREPRDLKSISRRNERVGSISLSTSINILELLSSWLGKDIPFPASLPFQAIIAHDGGSKDGRDIRTLVAPWRVDPVKYQNCFCVSHCPYVICATAYSKSIGSICFSWSSSERRRCCKPLSFIVDGWSRAFKIAETKLRRWCQWAFKVKLPANQRK